MELTAQVRTILGKKVKTLIAEGLIPAEFYSRGMKNEHLTIKSEEFKKVYKEAGENTIVNLVVNSKKLPSLIYEVKEHRLNGEIVHVDFYGVHMDEKIKTHIPIEFKNEPAAIKEKGGVLNKNLHEIEVEALPADLPRSFELDLSVLVDIGQSIYVQDLKVPKGVKVLTGHDMAIAGIAAARAEEVAPVAPVDLGEIKVETEEKKAEREAEKAATKEKNP
ncbi:MAG: 50S ribosomal protein L25 [Candidatus Liptonbacteria bacterium]|nr:50S ribosomal protein L25 [Candidatus Liptonbacteria bacterium]